jgi:hypothetical protein
VKDSAVLRSFAGGELAPALAARADLAKYAMGLRTCRNFVVQRHGGVTTRPGTKYVATCASDQARLMRYVSETAGESVLIEAGPNYLRFYKNGAPVTIDSGDLDAWSGATAYVIGDLVLSGGNAYYCIKAHTNHVPPNATYWDVLPIDGSTVTYELATTFATGFYWNQSGRTITLTALGLQPYELIFEAIDRWVLRAISTAPNVLPPANVALAATAGTRKFGYVVTSAHPLTYEESIASGQALDVTAAEPTAAAPHAVSWDAETVNGDAVPEYYVYCDPYGNGVYGFIGATSTNAFNNPGITPDFSLTPPIAKDLFDGGDATLMPAVSATYQQRRLFGNTQTAPDSVNGSRVGFISNFTISSPLQADDAIAFKIAGNNHHPIRHMLDLKQLIVCTDGGAWAIKPPEGRALAPNEIQADQESYVGFSAAVKPCVLGQTIVYVEARNRLVHELKLDQQAEGLAGKDLTVYAGHLFEGFTIVAMDYALSPYSMLWAVRSDGQLLGLTYLPDQDVWGWHRHDTQLGGWEDAIVVPEAGEDVVYLKGARTINGSPVRFIERMSKAALLNYDADCFCMDAGLSYAGAPVSSVSGLDHLEGCVVGVVADGVVVYNGDPTGAEAASFQVISGTINLPAGVTGSNIHVGLRVPAYELETLDLDVQGTNVADKKKRVAALTAMLDGSARSFSAGPTSTELVPFAPASYDPTDKAFTGKVEINLVSTFGDNGRVFLRHTDPLPLTVLALIPNVDIGG